MQGYKPPATRRNVLRTGLDKGCGNVSDRLYNLECWGSRWGLDFLS